MFGATDSSADLVGDVLVCLVRMAGRPRTISAIHVDNKVTEDTGRQLADLKAELGRNFDDEKAVHAGLVRCDFGPRSIDKSRVADKVAVKSVAVTGVVIE